MNPVPADPRREKSSTWLHRMLPVAAVVAVVLAVYSGLTDDLPSTVTFVVLALVLVAVLVQTRRAAVQGVVSARARRDWDGDRVRTVTAAAGVDLRTRRVAAVRAVRTADRRLSLQDAVELVESAAKDR